MILKSRTLVCSGCLVALGLAAHTVVWPENPIGWTPSKALVLSYPGPGQLIRVTPATGEPCTVVVNLDSQTSSLIEAQVVGSSPATEVDILVTALRPPQNGQETATVSGEWHATGLPVNNGCDAVTPNPFSVPVVVITPTSEAQEPNAVTTSDPVSTSSGEIAISTVDFSSGGPLPLHFARYYGSRLSSSGVHSALGPNWMHNFDQFLSVAGSTATVVLYQGKLIQFQQTNGEWQMASPERFKYQLISTNGGYQFADPPAGILYTFSSDGKLAAIQDRNGNTLSVTQGPYGPETVSDGLGRILTFTYTNRTGVVLASVEDQSGRKMTFEHSDFDLLLTGAIDGLGNTNHYSYTSGSTGPLLTGIQKPAGNTPWRQEFDGNQRVIRQTDSAGYNTLLSFDTPSAGTTTVTDPLNGSFVHTYDDKANLTKATDPAGKSASFAYDGLSRLVSAVDRRGNTNRLSYDPASGYVASFTNAVGNATRFTYEAQRQGAFVFYNLTAVHYADGTSIALDYDGAGNPVRATNQAGRVYSSTYNGRGQLLRAINAGGGVMRFAYNSAGTLAAITNAAGGVTLYGYDDRGRVSDVRFPDGSSNSYAYDALDRLVSLTDQRGYVVSFAYDANGNIESVTNRFTEDSSAVYDSNDLVSAVSDPLGNTLSFRYDARGSLAAATNAAGEVSSFTYDALNRLTSVADPSGKGPLFSYDAEGDLTGVTDAMGNKWSFTLDGLGRSVAMTTPLGESYHRVFDSMGRVSSSTDPLGRQTQFQYDVRGQLDRIMAPGGGTASFERDDLGLLVKLTDPNGNAWWRTNDPAGRLLSRRDPLGQTVSYDYDGWGRIRKVTTPEGTITLARDAAGNVIHRQYSDGLATDLTYDRANRPTGGTGVSLGYDADGRIVDSNGLKITRDGVGRITGITYASGKTVTYAYDERGLLAGISDWAGGGLSFGYDDAARLTLIVRTNGVVTQFSYDADGRVTGIAEKRGGNILASITVKRDALGRITDASRTSPAGPAALPVGAQFAYDAAHQLAGQAYDGLGRMTADGSKTFTWNLASELTGYSVGGQSVTCAYDAFGTRISRTVSGGTTENFVVNYALGLPVVAVVRTGGSDWRYYVYSPSGALLYAIDASNEARHYYHFDETGSTSFLTDDAGAVTDTYAITPYGEKVTASGGTDNPFTWLGRWGIMQEGGSGLYYMRERYYDSGAARFLSRDPVLELHPAYMNPYQYAAGDPISNFDPLGRKAQSISAGGFLGPLFTAPASVLLGRAGMLQEASSAATARALQLSESGSENLFDWYEGFLNGSLYSEGEGGALVQETAVSEEQAANYVKFIFGEKPGNPLTGPRDFGGIFTERGAIHAKRYWYESTQSEIATLEEEGTQLAGRASKMAKAGKVLGAAGIALQTGLAIHDDIKNRAGFVVTANDAVSTVGGNAAVLAAPPVAVADLVTGGAISGGIHNAIETPGTVARVVFGRVNLGDAAAIKKTYTRFAVGRWAWHAGEFYANLIFGN